MTPHPDGCDACGKVRELYHFDAVVTGNPHDGAALCDACNTLACNWDTDNLKVTVDPQNKLVIGYKLDGVCGEFEATVDAWQDLEKATKLLQLHLIEKVLSINTWVHTRERVN